MNPTNSGYPWLGRMIPHVISGLYQHRLFLIILTVGLCMGFFGGQAVALASSNLSGFVWDADGVGAGGFSVQAFIGSGSTYTESSTCTASDGSYSLFLPAGIY